MTSWKKRPRDLAKSRDTLYINKGVGQILTCIIIPSFIRITWNIFLKEKCESGYNSQSLDTGIQCLFVQCGHGRSTPILIIWKESDVGHAE